MELKDKIGRKSIVEKINTLIDNLATDKHFCLALDGEWGSGKSFVLDMLCEKLENNSNYFVVRYDAWENSFYEEPLIAILSSIIDSSYEKLPSMRGYKKALKETGEKLCKDIIDELSSKPGKLGTLATVIKKIIENISAFNNATLLDTNDSQIAKFKSYQSVLKEVKDNLLTFTSCKNRNGNHNKLIIVVDELDRCLPDMQLKILERLHHLFDINNCVVICALNTKSVAQNVVTTYGVDGFEYLRKFFDFTFTVEKSTSIYLANLLSDLKEMLQKVNSNSNDFSDSVMIAFECLEYGSKKVLTNIDNREITRFYESIVSICHQFDPEKLSPQYLFFIIIALFIRRYLYHDFLTEKDILGKKVKAVRYDNNGEMPYYDYIKDFIGLNRLYMPNELSDIVREQFPSYSWDFNKLVYRFIQKTGWGDFNEEECMKIRELILTYGGEPKMNENK